MKIFGSLLLFCLTAALVSGADKVDRGVELLQLGVRPNYDAALQLIREAADEGSAKGLLQLAQLYSSGIGEPRGPEDKPIALIRRAVTKNSEGAEYEMESRLRKGLGVELDLLEAAEFSFKRRLRWEGRGAQFRLEDHVRHHPRKEEILRLDKLFINGISRGDRAAMVELANLHAGGIHGKTNLPRAAALLTLAQSPEAGAKAQQLSPADRKRMDADIRWMRSPKH